MPRTAVFGRLGEVPLPSRLPQSGSIDHGPQGEHWGGGGCLLWDNKDTDEITGGACLPACPCQMTLRGNGASRQADRQGKGRLTTFHHHTTSTHTVPHRPDQLLLLLHVPQGTTTYVSCGVWRGTQMSWVVPPHLHLSRRPPARAAWQPPPPPGVSPQLHNIYMEPLKIVRCSRLFPQLSPSQLISQVI